MKFKVFFQAFVLPLTVLLYGCWSDDQTQMLICATDNNKACIKKYIESGIDLNGVGKESVSPFYAALKNKNFEVADMFVSEERFDINGISSGRSYLWNVINSRNLDAVRYLKDNRARFKVGGEEYQLCKDSGQEKLLELFDQ